VIRSHKTRSIVSLVLALLLVAIQQAGFAHALTHLSNPAPQNSSRNDSQHPAQKACIDCIVFAQLGSALPSTPATAIVAPPHIAVATTAIRVHDPAFVPYFHSRAPPPRV
jgi:hypothetical protein